MVINNLKRIPLAVMLFFLCATLLEAEENPQSFLIEDRRKEVELIIYRGEEQGVDRLIEILAELEEKIGFHSKLYRNIYKALCLLKYTQSDYVGKATQVITCLNDKGYVNPEERDYYFGFFKNWTEDLHMDYLQYQKEKEAGDNQALDNFILSILAKGKAHPQLLPYLARANLDTLVKNPQELVKILRVLYPKDKPKGQWDDMARKYEMSIKAMLTALQGHIFKQNNFEAACSIYAEVFPDDRDEMLADVILVLTGQLNK